jgi:hypothetical protein
MPVAAGNKRHDTTSGFMTHQEYKQKLLENPEVKKAYDALEPEYQREVAKIHRL